MLSQVKFLSRLRLSCHPIKLDTKSSWCKQYIRWDSDIKENFMRKLSRKPHHKTCTLKYLLTLIKSLCLLKTFPVLFQPWFLNKNLTYWQVSQDFLKWCSPRCVFLNWSLSEKSRNQTWALPSSNREAWNEAFPLPMISFFSTHKRTPKWMNINGFC